MLLENRTSNFLESDNIIPFDEINHKIWSLGAEIFVPAASSRLITQEQLDQMIENGLEVISCGQMYHLLTLKFSLDQYQRMRTKE